MIAQAGEAAIAHWTDHRGALMLTQGQAWTYADGFWRAFDDELDHIMRVTIQGVVRATGQKTSPQLLNAAWRYVMEHPGLLREGIAWDAAGVIVCRNNVIDPRTRKIRDHSETDYATCRVEADIDAAAACPIWIAFLETAFGNIEGDERRAVTGTLAEWFGSALVRGKSREMTKGLIVYGPSRRQDPAGAGAPCLDRRACHGHAGPGSGGALRHAAADPCLGLDCRRCGLQRRVPRRRALQGHRHRRAGQHSAQEQGQLGGRPRYRGLPHRQPSAPGQGPVPRRLQPLHRAAHDRRARRDGGRGEIDLRAGDRDRTGRRLAERRYFDPPKVMREAVGMFEHDNNPIGAWLATAVHTQSNPLPMCHRVLVKLTAERGGRSVSPPVGECFHHLRDAVYTAENLHP